MKKELTPKKQSDGRILGWGVGLVIGALIVGIGGYFWLRNGDKSDLIMVFVMAGCLLSMGLLMFVSVLTVKSMRRHDKEDVLPCNYFLYDFKTKQPMSPGDLTPLNIAEHVAMMVAMHRHGQSLYMEDLLSETSDFEEVDKPLICWFMLYYWIRQDDIKLFEDMLSWGKTFADTFKVYLTSNEDDREARALADQLTAFVLNANTDPKDVRNFFVARTGLVENRMLDYVQIHLHELHWDPYL